jgi:membrane peptidoglycan carboxypeptidase
LSIAQLVAFWKRFGRRAMLALLIVAALAFVYVARDEVRTSRRQAAWLSEMTRSLTFQVQPGLSSAIRFPGAGPSDQRLGYHALPEMITRLNSQGYPVTAQARMSAQLLELSDKGLFATYHEKTQAGLELRDCRGEPLFTARYPERVYDRFEAVPKLLVDSLLFIENRELFDPHPSRNPAIEWDRLGKAMFDQALRRVVDETRSAGGGSTLATQIEKYRHSPEGRTETAKDKLRQMASASLRGYIDGEDTTARRRQILLDYLNTVPLSAHAGFGEVNGVGDAMWIWYGREFADLNALLSAPIAEADHGRRSTTLAFNAALLPRQALAYKQALSLMVAQRRPSHYLTEEAAPVLREVTDRYLRVMADAGVITPALRDAALPLSLKLQLKPVSEPQVSFVGRKASTALRGKLQSLLGMPRAYDLDRLDLAVESSLAGEAQHTTTALLRSLNTTEGAKAAGLYGFHLLNEGDDTSKIVVSFTLFERTEGANLLRVQTDNLDQPFDLNEGARLDLGSTAKLRTLITYLEQVAQLHGSWNALDAQQLGALNISTRDPIARWARDYLAKADDRGLAAMLSAAMQRTYSANPSEGFFTGGGLHHFDNFDPLDNHRTMSLNDALAHSVNLVFIRLMRDVVYHVMAGSAKASAEILEDSSHPKRQEYLSRFADKEGSAFVARFYRKYASKPRLEAEDLLLQSIRPTPSRLASIFYGLEPQAGAEGLTQFLAQRLPGSEQSAQALHEKYRADRWSLADRGYLASVHPLELWVVSYLRQHPTATLGQTLAASRAERQEVYGWLFKTRHKGAQDGRIRGLLEVEAFLEIHRAWKRLGYPFESLTPSYATALGASGDRPAALAELMGIIVNRGKRLPATRIDALQFARGTPYETRLESQPARGEQVLSPEVADVARRALIGVVEEGTAKRLKGALVLHDGTVMPIGGKTGTGDHRFDVYGRGGQLISSRVIDRSATLVFLIGDRYFGTIMAYVHEPYAAKYKFTSALPAQLLKTLTPSLVPLIEGSSCDQALDRRK